MENFIPLDGTQKQVHKGSFQEIITQLYYTAGLSTADRVYTRSKKNDGREKDPVLGFAAKPRKEPSPSHAAFGQ